MGVVIPNTYAQATVRFACQGVVDTMVTTFGYKTEGTVAPSVDADVIMGLLTGAAKLLGPAQMTNEYTVLGVQTTETFAGEPIIGVSSAAPATGTIATGSLPPNCAFLVRKNTNVGGRRGRGRMYFPPVFVGETGVGASGAITGTMSAIQTKLNTFVADMVTANLPLYLFHSNDPEDTTPLAPTPIQSLTLQPLLATQRRRMR